MSREANRILFRASTLAVIAAALMVLADVEINEWRARRSVEKGMRLLANGEYKLAIRALLPTVARMPDHTQAHYYLGLAYSRAGLHEAAVKQLKDAVHSSPRDAQFHEGLGEAYRAAGGTANALSEFEEAIRDAPGEPRYQLDRAGLLLDQHRVAEALVQLRRTVQARPGSPQVHLFLADTLKRRGDREGMAREYCEVIRLAPAAALGELARQKLRSEHQPDVTCGADGPSADRGEHRVNANSSKTQEAAHHEE